LREPYDYIDDIPIRIVHDDIHIREILSTRKAKGCVEVVHIVQLQDIEMLDISGSETHGFPICNYKNTGDSSFITSNVLFKVKTRSKGDWILKSIGLGN
jgi:hypothetical protein